jgi:predicted DNA binding CopG/RHH family protein
MRKTKMLSIRLTETELRTMKEVAQKRGVTLSRLIREAVIGTKEKEVKHEAKIRQN